MKFASLILALGLMVFLAYQNAQKSLTKKVDVSMLRLSMPVQELEQHVGSPISRELNTLTYLLEDSSQLVVTVRDGLVATANLKYHRPLRIEDPELRKLSLVQMTSGDIQDENPRWFYAGKPEQGLIYKITQAGTVESLSWVAPFTYADHKAKQLQALLTDFKNQQSSNL